MQIKEILNKGRSAGRSNMGVKLVLGAVAGAVLFFGGFTYNEAGYQTHIRTIYGHESVATEVGYAWKGFGRATPWKQAQTIQFTAGKAKAVDDAMNVEGFRVTFLGNVDAAVEASTRFRMPRGEQFLKIAQEYRTPENFFAVAIVPAVRETLQTTASMMSADEYFAGGRSEFSTTFDDQLQNGQYHVRRHEKQITGARTANDDEAAVSGREGTEVRRSQFEIVKLKDPASGNFLRKAQPFRDLGVGVVEARITDMEPNDKFKVRMQKVQDSQAQLALARQERMREEEQKILVIAKGEREVEEKRQLSLKDQIDRTTQAETDKQLALIEANKFKEQAVVQKDTAATQLQTAELEAKRTKLLADAEAHAKKVVIEANGALEQKLEAWVKAQQVWADAAKVAPVPQIVMGGSGHDGTGRNTEVQSLMQMLMVNQAKSLSLDLNVKK
ncbi:hypothetical protein LMG26857_03422 [Achromobacter anxifer]|uniref:SPFH domain-containing protein n=1 Tax=Achromobacter anxifer TaxID=1287737 RepID=UPI00155C8EB3|nr:SPFH domain-containing protein [Achromobacter anxifer]CAB5514363.1 hypothetical protein LMG26857_03422 [Achromobacter anxifer]